MKETDAALTKRAHELAKRSYAFVVRESDGEYEITFPELRGCRTSGKTLEEALGNVQEAKEVWMGGMLICGGHIPEPSGNLDYSGRFVVRCSRSLHKALSQTAALEGVSLNQLVVQAISEKAGRVQARDQYKKALDDLKAMSFRAEVVGFWAPLKLEVSMRTAQEPEAIREVA